MTKPTRREFQIEITYCMKVGLCSEHFERIDDKQPKYLCSNCKLAIELKKEKLEREAKRNG